MTETIVLLRMTAQRVVAARKILRNATTTEMTEDGDDATRTTIDAKRLSQKVQSGNRSLASAPLARRASEGFRTSGTVAKGCQG